MTRWRVSSGVAASLDLVVEALAHFFLTVNAEDFGDLGALHLRLNQDIGIVAVIEGADSLAGKFNVREPGQCRQERGRFCRGRCQPPCRTG